MVVPEIATESPKHRRRLCQRSVARHLLPSGCRFGEKRRRGRPYGTDNWHPRRRSCPNGYRPSETITGDSVRALQLGIIVPMAGFLCEVVVGDVLVGATKRLNRLR